MPWTSLCAVFAALGTSACCSEPGCYEPDPEDPVAIFSAFRLAHDAAWAQAYAMADAGAHGNAIAGEAGVLGRPGKVALALRVTGTKRDLPQLGGVTVSTGSGGSGGLVGESSTGFGLRADMAVGLSGGKGRAGARYFGTDLIGSAFLVPGLNSSDLKMSSSGRLGFGSGLRVGLLEESRRRPGLSIGYRYDFYPRFESRAIQLPVAEGGQLSTATSALRLRGRGFWVEAAKQFGRIGISTGISTSRASASSSMRAMLSGAAADNGSYQDGLQIKASRTRLWVGTSYRLPMGTVVGEIGRSLGGSGGSPTLAWTGSVARARTFFTIGVRLGDRPAR